VGRRKSGPKVWQLLSKSHRTLERRPMARRAGTGAGRRVKRGCRTQRHGCLGGRFERSALSPRAAYRALGRYSLESFRFIVPSQHSIRFRFRAIVKRRVGWRRILPRHVHQRSLACACPLRWHIVVSRARAGQRAAIIDRGTVSKFGRHVFHWRCVTRAAISSNNLRCFFALLDWRIAQLHHAVRERVDAE